MLFYYIGEGLSNLFAVQYARRCLKKSLDNSGSEVYYKNILIKVMNG